MLILRSHGGFDTRMSRFIHRTDFSYFCAVVLPDASAETLRTLCDWGNWVSLMTSMKRKFALLNLKLRYFLLMMASLPDVKFNFGEGCELTWETSLR